MEAEIQAIADHNRRLRAEVERLKEEYAGILDLWRRERDARALACRERDKLVAALGGIWEGE